MPVEPKPADKISREGGFSDAPFGIDECHDHALVLHRRRPSDKLRFLPAAVAAASAHARATRHPCGLAAIRGSIELFRPLASKPAGQPAGLLDGLPVAWQKKLHNTAGLAVVKK